MDGLGHFDGCRVQVREPKEEQDDADKGEEPGQWQKVPPMLGGLRPINPMQNPIGMQLIEAS